MYTKAKEMIRDYNTSLYVYFVVVFLIYSKVELDQMAIQMLLYIL